VGAHRNFSREGRGYRDMASTERQPITGVYGRSPQRDPGAEPIVGSEGEAKPPAESRGTDQRGPGAEPLLRGQR